LEPEIIPQVVVNGLILGLLYALISLGVNIIFGVIAILNFAHGELYMLGAYVLYYIINWTGINYWPALLISAVSIAILGVILQYLLFRHLRGKFVESMIVGYGLLFGLRTGVMLLCGTQAKGLVNPIAGNLDILGATLSNQRLIIVPICLVLVVLLSVFVTRFKEGQAMRAVMQDAETAALQGINIERISYLAFAIAAALAAVAGGLMAPISYITPMMGFNPLMKSFIIVTIGGIGSMPGALIVGLCIGLLESIVITVAGAPISVILSFVIMGAFLMFKPTGLFSHPM